MSLPSQPTIYDVQEIWNWVKQISNVHKDAANDEEKPLKLMEIIHKDLPVDFEREQYCFPSGIIDKFSSDYVGFKTKKKRFAFTNLLKAISSDNLTKNSMQAVMIMLIDTALYRAYLIIKDLSDGRFFYQLNGCVILDAMVIKPDKRFGTGSDIYSVLHEVSSKAKMRIESLDKERLWTLAMLNYKVNQYDTSIVFFEKFIHDYRTDEKEFSRIINAKIYTGYCYEKSERFDNAIELFEETLQELTSGSCKRGDSNSRIITELNHGLGHFYNERAVFSRFGKQGIESAESDSKTNDLIEARKRMEATLDNNAEYYSCYGSLYHEYGDYPTAQIIFDMASEKESIKSNNELRSELEFYIAQTKASMATNKDDQIKQAERFFKEFEEYCKKTFNFDGIVHARVFKIRTFLRSVDFSNNHQKTRKGILENIKAWQKELAEYSLSSYASKSIKTEYEKVLCILKIYRLLYSDNAFEWHTADLLYYLREFIKHMPNDVLELDYGGPTEISGNPSYLYQIALNGLWFWCVGSPSLCSEITDNQLFEFGLDIKVVSEEEKESAHISISQNRKPDLVVIVPPENKDSEFEREFNAIKSSIDELYFVYCPKESCTYNNKWFEKNITGAGKQFTYYSAHNEMDALLCAYCLRGFEVLRKELLNPIPLFSLAPTHFSASYNFQLGEPLDIIIDNISEHNNDSKSLRLSLKFIDDKYSNNWIDRQHQQMKEAIKMGICVPGQITICCPEPVPKLGIDCFIGYRVNEKLDVENLNFPHYVESGKSYTIKTLPSYADDYRTLEYALELYGKQPCEGGSNNVCTVYEGNSFLKDDIYNIASYCKRILRVIFNTISEYNESFDKPYCCIMRTTENPADNSKRKSIYIILMADIGSNEKGTKGEYGICCLEKGDNMKNAAPSVFVTYAWDSSPERSETYLREVTEFVNTLRATGGYNATFDRDLYTKNPNWNTIMKEGLNMDKVIVLLSKEYKRKADDFEKQSGVSLESNALITRYNKDPSSIIFAKLPSQQSFDIDEICPVLFSGVNIIDLSSSAKTDGYNLLYRTLAKKKIVGELAEVSNSIYEGTSIV